METAPKLTMPDRIQTQSNNSASPDFEGDPGPLPAFEGDNVAAPSSTRNAECGWCDSIKCLAASWCQCDCHLRWLANRDAP